MGRHRVLVRDGDGRFAGDLLLLYLYVCCIMRLCLGIVAHLLDRFDLPFGVEFVESSGERLDKDIHVARRSCRGPVRE